MIRNPAFPGDPVYDMAFNLYAMEEEGLLPTHRGCLNALCDYITHYDIDPQNPYDFSTACSDCGIDWELTSDDFEYIYDKTHISILF